MNSALPALIYAINAIFFLLTTVLLLRIWMQLVRVNYYDPVVQMIVKATDTLISPVRKLVPDIRAFNTAALVMAWVLMLVKVLLVSTLVGQAFHPLLLFSAFTSLIGSTLNLMIWLILMTALLSWIAPQNNAIGAILQSMTYPLLAPLRRVLPPLSGFDLSPIAALIILNTLKILMGG